MQDLLRHRTQDHWRYVTRESHPPTRLVDLNSPRRALRVASLILTGNPPLRTPLAFTALPLGRPLLVLPHVLFLDLGAHGSRQRATLNHKIRIEPFVTRVVCELLVFLI